LEAVADVSNGSKAALRRTAASGAKRTSVDKRQKQAGGMHVVPIGQNEHMHCSNPAREVARNPTVAVVGLKDPGSYLR